MPYSKLKYLCNYCNNVFKPDIRFSYELKNLKCPDCKDTNLTKVEMRDYFGYDDVPINDAYINKKKKS